MDYSKNKLKEYKYWELYISEYQNYLGRCYVWCKRENALELPDASEEEQKELFIILREVEQSLKKSFNCDMLNYAFLGNETHHLHGHIIPRYSHPVEFESITFTDDRWGKNYMTKSDFKIPYDVFEKIKETIINNL